MKKIVLAAATAAGFVASPALAQDANRAGGFFIGGVVGYDHMSIEVDDETGSSDGVVYGVNASYDFPVGSMLLGVEAELTDSTAGTSETDVFANGDRLAIDATSDIYVGARAGFPIGEGSSFYVKGGYTTGRVAISYDDGVDNIEESDSLGGFRLGFGGEFDLSGFTTRLEYRYSDYGEYEFMGEPTGASSDRHQIVLMVGKRF